MRGTAGENFVTENTQIFCVDDRLKQCRHAPAADDVPQLARELLLALLLGVAHGIGRRLHSLIDLPL